MAKYISKNSDSEGDHNIKRSFVPFPTALEDRMMRVLPCVNSEWKALGLGSLSSDEPKTGYGMHSRFKSLTSGVLAPREGTFDGYCTNTFYPLGLVGHCGVTPSKSSGLSTSFNLWFLTDAGEKYGAPIAAFTAKWAAEHTRSHYPFLGATQSTGDTRSPFNRAWILLRLTQDSNRFSRNIDLVKDMLVSERRITTHLQELKKAGLIHYNSINPEQDWVTYSWRVGEDPDKAKLNSFIARTNPLEKSKIINLLVSRNVQMTTSEIAKELSYTKNQVSRILISLREAGYLESTWVAAVKHSDISTTDPGNEYVTSYLKPVRDALMDEPILDEMNGLRKNLKNFALQAAEAYLPFSHVVKAKPSEQRVKDVLLFVDNYMKENGKGPRVMHIFEGTGTKNNQYIRKARKSGLISLVMDGSIKRFEVALKGRSVITGELV